MEMTADVRNRESFNGLHTHFLFRVSDILSEKCRCDQCAMAPGGFLRKSDFDTSSAISRILCTSPAKPGKKNS